jgi:MoaA/NifB/PqqE/SkfB family radical SAM enzyme
MTCNIWKNKIADRITGSGWQFLFNNDFWASVEYLLLCGGEPILSKDLVEITQLCLNRMPRLRKLLIATNGLLVARTQKTLPAIANLCDDHGVEFTVTVSLDGVGTLHDKIRGIPGHFQKTLQTLAFCKELQNTYPMRLNIGTTISNLNIRHLSEVIEFSQAHQIPAVFYMGWISENYYDNVGLDSNIVLSAENKKDLVDFFSNRIAASSLFDSHAYYYHKVIRMIQGEPRSFACPFADQGLILDALGDVYYCSNSQAIGNILDGQNNWRNINEIYHEPTNLAYRERLTQNVCPGCMSSCLSGVALQKLLFPYFNFLLKQRLAYRHSM